LYSILNVFGESRSFPLTTKRLKQPVARMLKTQIRQRRPRLEPGRRMSMKRANRVGARPTLNETFSKIAMKEREDNPIPHFHRLARLRLVP